MLEVADCGVLSFGCEVDWLGGWFDMLGFDLGLWCEYLRGLYIVVVWCCLFGLFDLLFMWV